MIEYIRKREFYIYTEERENACTTRGAAKERDFMDWIGWIGWIGLGQLLPFLT
jgi:hypothetical protein